MKVTFPDHHTGLVHVEDVLSLRTGKPRLKISFRREDFARVLPLAPPPVPAIPILGALADSVFLSLTRRMLDTETPFRPRLILHDSSVLDESTPERWQQSQLPYSIVITREDLALAAGDPGRLRFELHMLLGTPKLVAGLQAERRPRGAHALAGDLLVPVRAALMVALRLALQAVSDTELRAAIHHQLGSVFMDYRDYRLTGDHPQRHNATAARSNALRLVQRAFKGAWEQYDVKSPKARLDDGDSPLTAYRALLPPAAKRQLLAAFRAMPQDMQGKAQELWQRRLLVEGAGTGAREMIPR
jgi:hypothetical protein